MTSIADVTDILKALIRQENAKGRLKTAIQEIAKFYIENLDVNEEEVAIFLANKDKSMLSFACPAYLVGAGMIPVTATDAIVASIFRSGNPTMINSFSQQKHLSVFEIIKTPEGKIKPIWKMMGCLLRVENEKIGVVEISKRGEDLADITSDFSHENLHFLLTTTDEIAPLLKKLIPEDFRGKFV